MPRQQARCVSNHGLRFQACPLPCGTLLLFMLTLSCPPTCCVPQPGANLAVLQITALLPLRIELALLAGVAAGVREGISSWPL